MNSIEISNLKHHFVKEVPTLNDLNLTVPEGAIYGFLGPNGAGKSTTMKLILGILKMQSGSIHVFGTPLKEHRKKILYNIGSLIETPSVYGNLTAVENLLALQAIYQCPKSRISFVLDLVGLQSAGNKRVSKFSLGMKQRLAIAATLLHEPKLLILDEPTNGLDINGLVEIRALLKKINTETNTTIFISSHILSEVEKLADHIGIIKSGGMVYQGKLSDLGNPQTDKHTISLKTSNATRAFKVLVENNFSVSLSDSKVILTGVEELQTPRIVELILQNDMDLYSLDRVHSDLESIVQQYFNN